MAGDRMGHLRPCAARLAIGFKGAETGHRSEDKE
jgi:hypothetical protein